MNLNPQVGWKSTVVGLLIFAGLFYWFGIKPASIRRDCYVAAGDYEQEYQDCLAEHGVEDFDR